MATGSSTVVHIWLCSLVAILGSMGCTTSHSALAGTWCNCADGFSGTPNVVVRIRHDGSFDWTQTLMGKIGPAGRMRHRGDTGAGPWYPERQMSVQWADYDPAGHSRILLMEEYRDDSGTQQVRLAYHDATLVAPDQIRYRLMVMVPSESGPFDRGFDESIATLRPTQTKEKSREPFSTWHVTGERDVIDE